MPQVTAPISVKPSDMKPASVAPQAPAPVKSVPAGDAHVSTNEELKRVIAELQSTETYFTPKAVPKETPKPVVPPKPATPQFKFVAVAAFDESIKTIQGAQSAVTQTQNANEKLGAIETQTKLAVEALGKTFEGLHTSLLALDEKLFQVK